MVQLYFVGQIYPHTFESIDTLQRSNGKSLGRSTSGSPTAKRETVEACNCEECSCELVNAADQPPVKCSRSN